MKIGKVVVWMMVALLLGTCAFIVGVFLADALAQLEAQAPDVWQEERSELTAKPNYGYQDPISPQTTIEPKELYKLEEL